jgi:hypothetical protein
VVGSKGEIGTYIGTQQEGERGTQRERERDREGERERKTKTETKRERQRERTEPRVPRIFVSKWLMRSLTSASPMVQTARERETETPEGGQEK